MCLIDAKICQVDASRWLLYIFIAHMTWAEMECSVISGSLHKNFDLG